MSFRDILSTTGFHKKKAGLLSSLAHRVTERRPGGFVGYLAEVQ